MSFTLIGSIIPINSTLEKKQEAYPSFNVKIAVWTASSSSISSVYLQETSMFISCKKKNPQNKPKLLSGLLMMMMMMMIVTRNGQNTQNETKKLMLLSGP